ncbi:Putative NADPH dehydrogenase [Sparassis crispa]|uniref:NADPH dehydrogenase n=1 Tax=Sparassis crispa TaxID=139825 RepID=A0A401G6C3_9APHY|nr:Putative NADPH dehydrogenase [Sparassis crispa]GBE77697.1 Putative NADPH dehydrogenase [Sparassis crispa]
MPNINKPVPGADQYYPLNEPSIGSPYPESIYPQNATIPALFQPLSIKGITFKNRIFVAPMCQYSADNGHVTDWHLVHIGGFATRGAGAICMEATAVVPEGRISPQDAGLWTDSQIAPFQRVVNFAHAQGTLIGVQLAHAGRKASTLAPWVESDVAQTRRTATRVAQKTEGGWPDEVYGPSDLPFSDKYPKPKPMDEAHLLYVEDAFVKAIERCKAIGFDFIEIHAAHGYLLHEFVSPLSNTRTDSYGGSLENRLCWPLRLISKCRAAWSKPLFVRISATDWAEGPELGSDGEWKQWGIEQSKVYVGEMQKIGVDLVDCSGGGNWVHQNIKLGPGYQVPFAEALKKAFPNLPVAAVGLITDPQQAESYLRDGKADAVFLARELLRTPQWPIIAAHELGIAVKPANQHERAWVDMLTPAKASF